MTNLGISPLCHIDLNLALTMECDFCGKDDLGRSTVSKVEGKEKVILKWTSRKELTLNDILHISDIYKNLTSFAKTIL